MKLSMYLITSSVIFLTACSNMSSDQRAAAHGANCALSALAGAASGSVYVSSSCAKSAQEGSKSKKKKKKK